MPIDPHHPTACTCCSCSRPAMHNLKPTSPTPYLHGVDLCADLARHAHKVVPWVDGAPGLAAVLWHPAGWMAGTDNGGKGEHCRHPACRGHTVSQVGTSAGASTCRLAHCKGATQHRATAPPARASQVLDLHDLLRQRVRQHDEIVPSCLRAVSPLDLIGGCVGNVWRVGWGRPADGSNGGREPRNGSS